MANKLCFDRPHRSEPRHVKPGQRIHESVFQSIGEYYSPLAHLPDGFEWDNIGWLKENLMEKDPYTNIASLMTELNKSNNVSTERLEGLANVIATGELLFAHISLAVQMMLIE
jgi:hypothetical protein